MNRLVISGTGQVYKNLALEEALLRELEEGQCGLYLWVNDPSVILGNNQCAYLECNPGICRSRGIAVARRRSGGGAVYHDRGNLNFTFFYWPGRAGEE
ncbi:lipoate--protein ligase family protein, partial [Enterocloster asparagiformis]